MIKRAIAHFFSVVFHPLFISAYVMAFIIFVHPYAFSAFEHKQKVMRLLTVILCNTFFPLFAVFLLWRLQLIKSILLRTEKDRIVPYLIAMIFYFWTAFVFKRLPDTSPIAIHFLGGAFLAVCGAWICNIYFKVSMHAIALAESPAKLITPEIRSTETRARRGARPATDAASSGDTCRPRAVR